MWELKRPARQLTINKFRRWRANLSLLVVDGIIVRLCFPFAAVGFAIVAEQQNTGLLNQISLLPIIEVLVSLLLLDLIIYWQHRLTHFIPFLWRFHKVHHADLDYDLTTGSRFHPIEILFSMLIKLGAILLIGPPVIAVLIFELILNGMAMFNHANASLPPTIDHWVRKLLVTPDMHRVHHSIIPQETNSNFGFNLSLWDRVFKSYKAHPEKGNTLMTIGLSEYRAPAQVSRLTGMLMMPFTDPVSDQPGTEQPKKKNND